MSSFWVPPHFVSYHKVNSTAVKNFVEEFSDVFTAKTVGVTDEDDFIDSDDRDYVMRRIREKYLSNTTVTIVLIGECTKARKYVDWEIASTLRNDPVNGQSGLLGINMKSVGKRWLAPPRLEDNHDSEDKAGIVRVLQHLSKLSARPTKRNTGGVRPACNPHTRQHATSVQV